MDILSSKDKKLDKNSSYVNEFFLASYLLFFEVLLSFPGLIFHYISGSGSGWGLPVFNQTWPEYRYIIKGIKRKKFYFELWLRKFITIFNIFQKLVDSDFDIVQIFFININETGLKNSRNFKSKIICQTINEFTFIKCH